jgi:hypothetical protein
MTDRPIIFSAPMVRALLDGRKTMTRRLLWSKREIIRRPTSGTINSRWDGKSPWARVQPGDRLWVREAVWLQTYSTDQKCRVVYRATENRSYTETVEYPIVPSGAQRPVGKKPAIHMPRWASRLTLVATAVKTEPLLDISEVDARAEGFEDGQLNDGFGPTPIPDMPGYTIESPGTLASAAGMFQIAWAELHPDWDGYSSPDVVALTFEVLKTNIDTLARAA